MVETNGSLKTMKAKELSLDTLYKKCGFRVNDDFICRHTWKGVKIKQEASTGTGTGTDADGGVGGGGAPSYTVSVWAKKTGKANFENKYDFPPPIDKDLFFGTCAIVRTSDDGSAFLDLTKETWLKIYEKLFGGFEDIGDEDEYSEDDLANVDPSLLTANGYLKDGFVVSDKSLETTPDDTTSEEEVVSVLKKKRAAPKKKTAAKEGAEKTAASAAAAEKKASAAASAAEKKAAATESGEKPKVKANKAKVKVKTKAKEKEKEIVEKEESEGTTSELEEEVYTFSDDD